MRQGLKRELDLTVRVVFIHWLILIPDGWMEPVEKGIRILDTGQTRLFQLKAKPARAPEVTDFHHLPLSLNTQVQLQMPFYMPPSSLAGPSFHGK